MSRTTALGIPCPWSGDEAEPIRWTYHVWFWLYKNTRIVRHRMGLHDWENSYPSGDRIRRCSWCGQAGTA